MTTTPAYDPNAIQSEFGHKSLKADQVNAYRAQAAKGLDGPPPALIGWMDAQLYLWLCSVSPDHREAAWYVHILLAEGIHTLPEYAIYAERRESGKHPIVPSPGVVDPMGALSILRPLRRALADTYTDGTEVRLLKATRTLLSQRTVAVTHPRLLSAADRLYYADLKKRAKLCQKGFWVPQVPENSDSPRRTGSEELDLESLGWTPSLQIFFNYITRDIKDERLLDEWCSSLAPVTLSGLYIEWLTDRLGYAIELQRRIILGMLELDRGGWEAWYHNARALLGPCAGTAEVPSASAPSDPE